MKKTVFHFLAPLVIFVFVALTMTGCGSSPTNSNSNQAQHARNMEQAHLVVDDVRDPSLYKNIIVVCANHDEMISFHDKIIHYRYRLVSNRGFEIFKSKLDDKKVYVVLQDNLDQVPHQHYGLIHLKGHTKHMQPLIDMIKNRPYLIKDKETILLLGGCETAKMIDLVSSLQVIPITTKYIGQSAQNDYLDLQLHSMLDTMSVAQALGEVRRNASVTLDQYIVPGFR